MDLQALKAAQERLKAGGGDASEGFMKTKELTAEGIPFRLLPEPTVLGGIFYFPVIKYWLMVNGKRASLICSSTFGKKSVIQEEIDAARELDDEDVNAILDNPDTLTNIKCEEEMWMAGLKLEYKLDKGGNIVSVKVVDNVAKIFQCAKATLVSEMVKVATSAKALRLSKGAPDGIADRVNGSNLLLCRTGVKKLTRYTAVLDEQMEMEEKWYADIPNVYETAKNQMKTMAYQRAAIRNCLYGEEIPKEVQAKEDARATAAKEAYKTLKAAAEASVPKKKAKPVTDDEEEEAPTPKKKALRVMDEDDEDETPAPKKKANVAPMPKKKATPIEDDDDDTDEDDAPPPAKKGATKKAASIVDEDDDDAPIPVKKAAKKQAAVVDEEDEDEPPVPVKKAKKPALTDDDEEDDEPATVAKKKATVPAKKAAPAKKSILDSLDDLDDEED